MPLILRGARGVGKTYAVKELAKSFDNFVEVNFEFEGSVLKSIFEKDLDPARIIRDLSVKYKIEISEGKTLLFFDEIQEVPIAITALRYFYEKMPNLHVIAAGSLLDFAIDEVGIPVGRVEFLYMYPLSFLEFLVADGFKIAAQEILNHDIETLMSPSTHSLLLNKLAEYLAIGGMPKVVNFWLEKNVQQCFKIQSTILDAYKQDFGEYAKKHQIRYLEEIFNSVPLQLGSKFKYSKVGEYRKRELEPCISLLEKARVINKVIYSSGQGFPIGFQANLDDFKLIFLDVGLSQSILGLDVSQWLINPDKEFVNKGSLVEAFIGQEMLSYSDFIKKAQLYYWHRDTRSSEAEIDYIIQSLDSIVPIEIKSGEGRTLRSMHIFLETHSDAKYGIKLSTNNFSLLKVENKVIYNLPLYSVFKLFIYKNEIKSAIESLF